MKFYGRKPRVNRRRFTTKKRTYKKRATVSRPVKSYIKRTLHNQIENKTIQEYNNGSTLTNYFNNPAMLTLSMIPYTSLSQGVGSQNRIGDTIKTRRCKFSYVCYPAPYSSIGNAQPIPQDIIIIFGKVKNSRPQQPISSDFARLFQNGNTVRAPSNQLTDLISPFNKDWFTIYKVCKHKVGNAIIGTAGMSPTQQYYANNDYKLQVTRTIDLTKYCPKTVKFNDVTPQPTNDGLWMFAYCVNANNDPTSAAVPAFMNYVIDYTFEDA